MITVVADVIASMCQVHATCAHWLWLYVLGTEFDAKSTQFSPGKRSPGLERTVSRVPKKIALQPLMAGASVCPGGVLEDEAEHKMLQIDDAEQLEQGADSLSADSLSDDDLEGVPLAGNWCTDGDY